LKKDRENTTFGKGGFGKGGPMAKGKGGPFGRGGGPEPKPGPHISPTDVTNYPDARLYDPGVVRTIFLEFENKDWEAELADFYRTDVDVPATLTVDGKKYPNVGVHFRGMSSYFGVPAGSKHSLNVSLDYLDEKQRFHGHKTLNLLNSHDDASMMSTVLYSEVARNYIPTPRANFAKVVINGESWGVYVNVQQFNREFAKENFKSAKGARWKVTGSPGGGGGLEYVGDNVEDYKRRYEIKSGDDEKSWKALIRLCRTLKDTPADKLEAALKPMLDIEGLLWFLALDVTLINCDGYWIRASDYSIYLDEKGKFHIVPHDMNECFRPPQGPGMGGPGGGMIRVQGGPGGGGAFAFAIPRVGELIPGPMQDSLQLTDEQKKKLAELQKETDAKLERLLTAEQNKQVKEMRDRFGGFAGGPGGPGGGRGPRGVDLDPLTGLDDARKPLRSKVLAVPALRERYLQHVKAIAEEWLDWKKLGPVVARYRASIQKEVEADTRKLDSYEDFLRLTADAPEATPAERRGPGMDMPLRSFADQRRKYLMEYKERKDAK
jgi:spore coat protein CotH